MSEQIILKYKKLSENATTPTHGSQYAAGYDLYSAGNYTITSRGRALCMTDIAIELPDGCYGRVAPRSGLAANHSIDVGAGVIDQDYRGNIGVLLVNSASTDYRVKKGEKIAQLICEKIYLPCLIEVEALGESKRNISGFGSTGK